MVSVFLSDTETVMASGDTLDAVLPLGLRDERHEVSPTLPSPQSLQGENEGVTRGAVVASALEYPGHFPSGTVLLSG